MVWLCRRRLVNASAISINSHSGLKVEIYKKQWDNPSKHKPDYWLVDHTFIREFFAKVSGENFEKFKLELFIPHS